MPIEIISYYHCQHWKESEVWLNIKRVTIGAAQAVWVCETSGIFIIQTKRFSVITNCYHPQHCRVLYRGSKNFKCNVQHFSRNCWCTTFCSKAIQGTESVHAKHSSLLSAKCPPTWLTLFSQSPGFLVDNVCGDPRLQHWMFRQHDCPLLATERSLSPLHEHGTACQLKWRHQIPCKPSKLN